MLKKPRKFHVNLELKVEKERTKRSKNHECLEQQAEIKGIKMAFKTYFALGANTISSWSNRLRLRELRAHFKP